MRVPVFLDGADIACCLAVPSVGDPVEWALAWYDQPGHPGALEIRWAAEEPLRLDRDESRHIGVESGVVLTRGPLAAWWSKPGTAPTLGALLAPAHGFVPAGVPPTRGRVGEVLLVIGTERKTGHGHWEEVPEATSSWPIVDGHSWDDWEDHAVLAGPLPAGHRREPFGVLAVVDVWP